MKKKLFILIFSVIYQNISFSTDTLSLKYYPLKVGNMWTYYFEQSFIPYYRYRYRVTVTDSVTINNNTYFILFTQRPYQGNITETLRVDMNNGNILKFSPVNHCPWLQYDALVDSLGSHLHDSAKSGCDLFYRCTDTANHSIFGLVKPHKAFNYNAFENVHTRTYCKDFGLVNKSSWGGVGGSLHYLIGCIINGILYGDTNLVGVISPTPGIPIDFSLSQNYPNPFNPVTKIKFDVPLLDSRLRGNDIVILKIFDVLGREIAILVNEQLNPGTYEVEWNASNYPGGVYFYKLTTPEFTETRKMVLVK